MSELDDTQTQPDEEPGTPAHGTDELAPDLPPVEEEIDTLRRGNRRRRILFFVRLVGAVALIALAAIGVHHALEWWGEEQYREALADRVDGLVDDYETLVSCVESDLPLPDEALRWRLVARAMLVEEGGRRHEWAKPCFRSFWDSVHDEFEGVGEGWNDMRVPEASPFIDPRGDLIGGSEPTSICRELESLHGQIDALAGAVAARAVLPDPPGGCDPGALRFESIDKYDVALPPDPPDSPARSWSLQKMRMMHGKPVLDVRFVDETSYRLEPDVHTTMDGRETNRLLYRYQVGAGGSDEWERRVLPAVSTDVFVWPDETAYVVAMEPIPCAEDAASEANSADEPPSEDHDDSPGADSEQECWTFADTYVVYDVPDEGEVVERARIDHRPDVIDRSPLDGSVWVADWSGDPDEISVQRVGFHEDGTTVTLPWHRPDRLGSVHPNALIATPTGALVIEWTPAQTWLHHIDHDGAVTTTETKTRRPAVIPTCSNGPRLALAGTREVLMSDDGGQSIERAALPGDDHDPHAILCARNGALVASVQDRWARLYWCTDECDQVEEVGPLEKEDPSMRMALHAHANGYRFMLEGRMHGLVFEGEHMDAGARPVAALDWGLGEVFVSQGRLVQSVAWR